MVENKIKDYEEALKRASTVLHSSDLPAHRAEAERIDRIIELYKEKQMEKPVSENGAHYDNVGQAPRTQIDVVLGASFGDEGKGKEVAAIAIPGKSWVVRFNGGAQAAHTVELPDGRQYRYHHMGSASHLGCNTLLARRFVVNPILFNKEYSDLSTLKVQPHVYVDGRCPVTTPWDMEFAQATCCAGTHCGAGIYTTNARNRILELKAADLYGPLSVIQRKLSEIAAYYKDLAEVEGVEATREDGYMRSFLDECMLFNQRTSRMRDIDLLLCRTTDDDPDFPVDHIIFEGAQGLRLDKDNIAECPYTTDSYTGLDNVAEILNEVARIAGYKRALKPPCIRFITRSYNTWHGIHKSCRGDVSTPGETPPSDENNPTNQFQGEFHTGPLDIPALLEAIGLQLVKAKAMFYRTGFVPMLVVNCIDQQQVYPCYTTDDILAMYSREELVEELRKQLPGMTVYINGRFNKEN